jgi:hypothetical protein
MAPGPSAVQLEELAVAVPGGGRTFCCSWNRRSPLSAQRPAGGSSVRGALARGCRRLVVCDWDRASFFSAPSADGSRGLDTLRVGALEHHRTVLGIADRVSHGYRGGWRSCDDQLDRESRRPGRPGDSGMVPIFRRFLCVGPTGSGGVGSQVRRSDSGAATSRSSVPGA